MSNTSDTRTIYEIFRACRLCGAGGGYKMPIVQNVIQFDCKDVELREKIRECLQIEVRIDDKMPPLICELCVDKVCDFYEFLEMCRQTNKRTRLRLGLPLQTMPQGTPEDCILGVTETVFSHDEEKPQPRSRPCPKSKKNVVKVKEEVVKIETPKRGKERENHGSTMGRRMAKELADLKNSEQRSNSTSRTTRNRDSNVYVDSRSSSLSNRSSPVPVRETRRMNSIEKFETPRATRRRRDSLASTGSARETRETRQSANDDNISLGKVKQQEQKKKLEQQKQAAKSVPKKGNDIVKVDISSDSDDEALFTRTKRGRDKDTPKAEVPQKKIKLTIRLPPAPKPHTLALNECPACGFVANTSSGLLIHMRKHPVTYTKPDLACDPCCQWFPTAEDAAAHHKKHSKYKCRHCKRDYKQLAGYYEHFERTSCRPFEEKPDVQCQTCWAFFPTTTLMKRHKCPGTGSRPGGPCKICGKLLTSLKSLKKHEDACASKNKESKQAKSELSKPANNETAKPAKNETSKSAKTEASKSAKTEAPKLAKNQASKSAKNEASKSVKNQAAKPAKNEASKSTSKATKTVHISPKLRSRLRPTAVKMAKCDPLLTKRKSKTGRYNVADVPHDYGLDRNCTYPYKYSGVRVKFEPLCFDGMVSINKEIQRELYREEDYVHWDSDLSSDSENEVEEFGEKRRKVPSLTALSLKTIFSKRCLGKVPRKLRKVKQDKLFDSLFNTTVDENLSCNINSIIDNLSKEDSSSVNLLKFDNYDSDSVLDKSILGGGDDIDAVINDVNKNSNAFDVNASVNTNINDKNDLDIKKESNDGDETDASMTETNDDKKDELANKHFGISKEYIKNDSESDRTEDLSSQNGDTQDEIFNSAVDDTTANNPENKEETVKEDERTSTETVNVNENQETKTVYEDTNNGNQESSNDFEKESNKNILDNKESNVENEETNAKNEETYKNGDFLNGITDKSGNFDSEINDKNLMDDLNAEIGESETKDMESRSLDACSNFSIDNLIDKSMPQSFGLGSIGDEEFL